MDRHISEILTTSIRNQIAELDPDIRFTKKEIEDYLEYGTTIGFISKKFKNLFVKSVIISSSNVAQELIPRASESISLYEEGDEEFVYVLQVEDADGEEKELKHRKHIDVLTFYRLSLKKFRTENADLIKLLTLSHFNYVCEEYRGKWSDLLLFLYLRMNIRVLNIPFRFPEMNFGVDAMDDSDVVTDEEIDEFLEKGYLNFTKHNPELTRLVIESINKF